MVTFMVAAGIIDAGAIMQASAASTHLQDQEMSLAYLDNMSAATSLTIYDVDGNPPLTKNNMLDSGADVFCVSERVAAMTKRHVVACDTYIKTFGDTTVTVLGVINDFPLTFCRGTPDEVTIYLTALV